MTTQHTHEFKTGRSDKVETCYCGKFRFTDKAEPIAGIPARRHVLTNYTIQCTDETTKQKGCFLFDLGKYQETGKFYATSPVYRDLEELYTNTTREERKPCYVEYKGEL